MNITQIINAFAIIGGLLALYELGKAIIHVYSEWKTFTWKIIQESGEKLFEKLLDSQFSPDIIVGLGRGGSIAAGILAAHCRESSQYGFKMIPITSIDRFYLMKNGKRDDVRITGFHNVDVFQKKVLVVNADTYSGNTLKRAREVLLWDQPEEVRVATFLSFTKNRRPTFEAEFFGIELPESKSKKRLPWRSKKYKFENKKDVDSLKGVLVVLHGHVATGKTSVTDSIAKSLGYTPLYSDWFWYKYGLSTREHDRGVSASHNKHMIGRCWSALGSGYNVVLDCTSRWRSYRDKIRQAFSSTHVTVIFIKCCCPKDESLQRIQKRQFIGPHDFGTAFEYKRIESDFDEISDEEIRSINLLLADTDKLTCESSISDDRKVNEIMGKLTQAIEGNYFAKVRNRISESNRK